MNRRGRPRKPFGEKLVCHGIRFTDSELPQLIEAARRAGERFSEYVRGATKQRAKNEEAKK